MSRVWNVRHVCDAGRRPRTMYVATRRLTDHKTGFGQLAVNSRCAPKGSAREHPQNIWTMEKCQRGLARSEPGTG